MNQLRTYLFQNNQEYNHKINNRKLHIINYLIVLFSFFINICNVKILLYSIYLNLISSFQ